MSEVLALLLFRIAALALPRRVREAVGDEMQETFRAAWRDRRGGRRLAYALHSAGDLVRAGIGERWRARETSTERRPKVNSLWQDARYAARSLIKTPGFSFVAVLTLALGIGANVSIFSIVNAVLLRPLPFENPEHLVEIWESRLDRGWTNASFSHANFWDVQDQNTTFTSVGALRSGSINLTGMDYPERLSLGSVSASFFRTLGVTPAAGRTFADGEDGAGADGLQAVLSYGLWIRRFGGDPAVVGRSIALDGRGHTVIGVLPRGEPWLDAADIFVPLRRVDNPDRGSWELAVIGRLAPGVSIEAARTELTSIARGIAERYPEVARGMGITIAPSSAWVASEGLRRALWILMGAVGFLLLIACVNLANLSLARATGRVRERALRAALGASKGRLVRQALTESMLLSAAGAGAGVLLAVGVLKVLRSLDPGGIPRLSEVNLSPAVLGFTALAMVITGLATGIIPAIHAAQGELGSTLREGDRNVGTGRGLARVRGLLVAVEVSASLALLIGAGLLVRSFGAVLGTNRGFQTEDRVVAEVALPDASTPAQVDQFLATLTARLEGHPGITSVAAVSMRPLRGVGTGMGFAASDKPDPPSDQVPWAGWRMITAGYFRTLGVPLLRGRDFTPADQIAKPWRVIISQRIADLLWPGEEAVGRQLIMWKGQSNRPAEVIGVAADMRDWDLAGDPSYGVYFPYYGAGASTIYFVVHGRATPEAVRPVFRQLLAEIDATIPLARVASLEDLVGESVASRRFIMLLLTAFAVVALLLALAGVYGVLSYAVSRRTSEIRVRLALGASPSAVVRLIVGQGMRPVLIGLVVGVAAALALTRLMTGLLFGVSATDLPTYLGVATLLGGAALVSCYVPARQALGVDVVAALRKE
ncbi:MAG TPA: ABC transporter permease [Gemmatimonadales bacterium]|nr:ABC transporter permease [Gemmatimonadales bacterium]